MSRIPGIPHCIPGIHGHRVPMQAINKLNREVESAGARLKLSNAAITYANTIVNTAATTSFGTTWTCDANALEVGTVVRIRLWGWYGATGTPTMTFAVTFGGVIIMTTPTALTLGTGLPQAWTGEISLMCVKAGASGVVMLGAEFRLAPLAATVLDSFMQPCAQKIDTTATQTLSLSAKFSAASTENTITLDQMYVELIAPPTSQPTTVTSTLVNDGFVTNNGLQDFNGHIPGQYSASGLGQAWVIQSGAGAYMQCQGNPGPHAFQVLADRNSGGQDVHTTNTPSQDGSFSVGVMFPTGGNNDTGVGSDMGLVVRFVDINNFTIATLNRYGLFSIYEQSGGVFTSRASVSGLTVNLDQIYTIRASVYGKYMTATIDNANAISYSSLAVGLTSRIHGLRFAGINTNSRIYFTPNYTMTFP